MAPLPLPRSNTSPLPYHQAPTAYHRVVPRESLPTYGWKSSPSGGLGHGKEDKDIFSEDLNKRLKDAFLNSLCQRPPVGLTEV